jgi:hypothetical protein
MPFVPGLSPLKGAKPADWQSQFRGVRWVDVRPAIACVFWLLAYE